MSIITRNQLALGYVTGSITLATSIASTALNTIFAVSIDNVTGIEILGFVSVGFNVLCAFSLTFFLLWYTRKISAKPIEWTAGFCWRLLILGMSIACIALAAAVATLIWITLRLGDIPITIVGQKRETMVIIWWAVWAVAILSHLTSFGILTWWTSHRLHANSLDASSLDFGIPPPPPMEERPTTQDTNRSFQSQDPTIAPTPPRTPPARSNRNSLKSTYSTKLYQSSSRTKLTRNNSLPRDSAKSSFDNALTETSSIDDGFDGWDTSAVGREMRRTLRTTSPVTGLGLETIPGSRPESPAKPLDGPFLPESPHASTTDVTTMRDSSYFPSSPISGAVGTSSIPSSPPNFSRPTSRQYGASFAAPALAALPSTPPMEELIHPLFRASSPSPPPKATFGTSVHAAPMAGQTVSQRSITRMRSASFPHQSSPLTESESPESEGTGSPGPSIAEEQELPPILPGFILSAGQRSSLLGYGKRKDIRGRSSSSSQVQTSTF